MNTYNHSLRKSSEKYTSSSRNSLRKSTQKDVNVQYNGSYAAYEDPADYNRTGPVKAVRLG